MSHELRWETDKATAAAYLEELLDIGLSPELAMKLAGWNATYDYATFNDMQFVGPSASTGPVAALKLLFSRAPSRTNPGGLEGAVLDAGKLYAVFIKDVPDLNITTVKFKLDGSTVQLEGFPPYDFAGTSFDGSANRTTFVAGPHEIEAEVTAPSGVFIITAAFSVE